MTRAMQSASSNTVETGGDIVVFSILKPSVCAECGAELLKGRMLKMEKEKPLCLGVRPPPVARVGSHRGANRRGAQSGGSDGALEQSVIGFRSVL